MTERQWQLASAAVWWVLLPMTLLTMGLTLWTILTGLSRMMDWISTHLLSLPL